jgi:hypothetical protein
MNQFKIHPENEYFEIQNSRFRIPVRMPYIVMLADDEESVIRGMDMIAPNQKIKTIYKVN